MLPSRNLSFTPRRSGWTPSDWSLWCTPSWAGEEDCWAYKPFGSFINFILIWVKPMIIYIYVHSGLHGRAFELESTTLAINWRRKRPLL